MAHQISKTYNVQNDRGKRIKTKQIVERNSTDTDTKIETVKLKA